MTTEIQRIEGQMPVAYQQDMLASELLDRRARILQVMETVMKDGVHFGKIGTGKRDDRGNEVKLKPILFQPGAELLMTTFRLAADFPRADMICTKTENSITYEVRCVITTQDGIFLGAEWGYCSSNEEKYAWKACYINEEYEAADPANRSIKFSQYREKAVEKKQRIRVNYADVANTILAMACKRAKVRAVRAALAASDLFGVNVEDLPQDLQDEYFGGGADGGHANAAQAQALQSRHNGVKPVTPPPPATNVMDLIRQVPKFNVVKADGTAGFSNDLFRFLSELNVSTKAWKTEWSEDDANRVVAALQQVIAGTYAPSAPVPNPYDAPASAPVNDPPADGVPGVNDFKDPFGDQ